MDFPAGIWVGRKENIEHGEHLLAMAKIESTFECMATIRKGGRRSDSKLGEIMREIEMSCCMVVITFHRLRRFVEKCSLLYMVYRKVRLVLMAAGWVVFVDYVIHCLLPNNDISFFNPNFNYNILHPAFPATPCLSPSSAVRRNSRPTTT